jgi:hypothetical protein
MPLKTRHGKELLVEGSEVTGGHLPKTTQATSQPQAVAEPRLAMAETRRPGEPHEKPTTQAEAPATNTFAPNT